MLFNKKILSIFIGLALCQPSLALESRGVPKLYILKETKHDVVVVPLKGQCKNVNGSKIRNLLRTFKVKDIEDTLSVLQSRIDEKVFQKLNLAIGNFCELGFSTDPVRLLGRLPLTDKNSSDPKMNAIAEVIETEIPITDVGVILAYKQPTYFNQKIKTLNLMAYNNKVSVCPFNTTNGDQYMILSTSKVRGYGDLGLKCTMVSKETYTELREQISKKRSEEKIAYATIADRFGIASRQTGDIAIKTMSYTASGIMAAIDFALDVGKTGLAVGTLSRAYQGLRR